jgi:hypothetical protein
MVVIQWLVNRLRLRWSHALLLGVIFGTLVCVWDWLGLPTKSRPWSDPHPLSEVWWRFPLAVALFFVAVLLMPTVFDKDRGL